MAVFQDTWKLDIDTGFVRDLGTAEAQLDRLDDSFDTVTKASKRTSRAFDQTEKEAAKVAKAMERDAAVAARELARELARADREAEKVAKTLARDAAKGAQVLARALAKADREAEKVAKTLKRDTAKAAKASETAMNKAARAADREAAALLKVKLAAKALKLDNTRKGVEGLSSSLGVAAINGETLTNGWLAAGVAAGTLAASVAGLATKSLTAYAKKNKEAGDAVERFNKANDRLLVGLGKAIFAEEKGVKALDSFAGRMDNLGASIKNNRKEIRGFAEFVVDATEAVVTFYTFGLQAASFPFIGFIDLVKQGAGIMVAFALQTAISITSLLDMVGILPASVTKDVIGPLEQWQTAALRMSNIQEGLVVNLHRSMSATRDFSDDMAGAAKGTKDFSRELQKSERAVQEFQGPIKNWVDEDTGTKFAKSIDKIGVAFKELQSVMSLSTVDSVGAAFAKERERLEGVLVEIEQLGAKTAKQAGFGGGFGQQRKGFGSLAGGLTAPTATGVGGALDAEGVTEAGVNISDQLGDFGASGIALATDQLSTFIETMAAGTFEAGEFGKGILMAVGGWIGDFGEAMIMAGVMSQFVQSGQLLIAPAAAIGLGLAAVTLGGLMSGIGGSGGGRASASSSSDASARRTQRTLSNDRSSSEDREDTPIILVMDRAKVGEAMRADNQQASRRGQFTAGHSLRGLR